MGRLLHDVGAVSAKEAHKNQRDSAAAGKGRAAAFEARNPLAAPVWARRILGRGAAAAPQQSK